MRGREPRSSFDLVIPMELVGVRVEVPANTPIVVLREQVGSHRLLPIVIGTPEASSIHAALEGIESPRPLTHDLMVAVFQQLGVSVQRVVVTEVRDHVFYAELHLTSPTGDHVVSSRPSDAIALAARLGTPLFASESLLLQAAQEPEVVSHEAEAEAIMDEFRDFLDDLDPDDFKAP
jgi:uncharacterized protein